MKRLIALSFSLLFGFNQAFAGEASPGVNVINVVQPSPPPEIATQQPIPQPKAATTGSGKKTMVKPPVPSTGTASATMPKTPLPVILPALGSQKPSKPAPMVLPGLGTTPGKGDFNRPRTIHSFGGNEVIFVSNSLPNRIATPFKRPRIIDRDEIDYKVAGQDIIFSLNDPETPVAIFIRDDTLKNSPVVSLTLIPKAIPPQNILIVLEEGVRDENGSPVEATESASGYTGQIKGLLKSLALGAVPSGFSSGDIDLGVARAGQVLIVPQKLYSGRSLNVYRYEAQNIGKEPVELSEPSFYRDGVRAVAFFPAVKLEPNATTTVFVVADKLDQVSPKLKGTLQ